MFNLSELFPYKFDKKYSKPVAYFSMEFAVDQPLKIYSGGLGFLAGSHLRSAYELKQDLIGIGILWKKGYYDQERNQDQTMRASFRDKDYHFLVDTKILFPITIHGAKVWVKAYLLKPETFKSAPLFLLSTDIPENDYLAQTISHRLYDPNETTRVAQSILLGTGGAKLLDVLERQTEIYHMNEGHALPLCFYLLDKYKDINEVKKRVVFTTHTPEKAGNEEHSVSLLNNMSFFNGLSLDVVEEHVKPENGVLNYTLAALRMAKIANGVSQLHGEVARKMWNSYEGICDITAITNAQNKTYWRDAELDKALEQNNNANLVTRKKELKNKLFRIVANQTGKLFDENVLTIVWARRFAAYKRANLILADFNRFLRIAKNQKYPIQIIWAGKPYPEDYGAINIFNDIYWKTKELSNCTVVTGYELWLSGHLKKGSDIWLNNPKLYHEASGTSGMTAAMNASVNFSIPDGWVPEFSKHGRNSFLIQPAPDHLSQEEKDRIEAQHLLDVLEYEIIPMYYDQPEKWAELVKTSMREVTPFFDSGRMADEYYEKLYHFEADDSVKLNDRVQLKQAV
ncbi:alpha-glucan family phosphorylase [Chryseosolibacter indicus]|uniref:Alpha-glucan family phosphorylase n=1 Tax=Chryseosolibacter indicus TaxID=2782351 RepID=A0ABS5VMW0_9BACT|nr:alpha-glucan family phosphorylase [Chryseosolibacter indicus]MBT1702079.1 alpha-glucan family phosphorylase [Chryseosolibacter indicus]